MKKKLPKLTAAEFEIMGAVWKNDESTVTEIMNRVNADQGKTLARSTIQMQISRLEDKGWLNRREVGNKFYFSSAATREQAGAMIADNVRRTFFGGSCTELVKALFSNRDDLSAAEVEDLRRMIKNVRSQND
jgi:predicted transcriptional regulator